MAGIEKIQIPIKQSELSINTILPYLTKIIQKFKKNQRIIKSDYNKYCLKHNILNKTRVHTDDNSVNNIVLQPHLMAMVDWKTGYVFGNAIKYAQTKDAQNDSIEQFNKYIRNSNKAYIDRCVGMWAYSTGVGYYFIEPKRSEFDIDSEAPFSLYCREADTCTKVYSSYNGNLPLFDILYTSIETLENDINTKYDIIDVYLPDYMYEFKVQQGYDISLQNLVKEEIRPLYHKLPLVEKRLNPNGIGIVAMAGKLQDALDKISSNELDNIEEVVNVIYKYKGVNIGDTSAEMQTFHKNVRKNGAVVIPFLNGLPFEPDLDILKTEALDFSDVKEVAYDIERIMYSTVGVPLATNNTNSGGTTKSGSEVANGYDNAYNRALNDIRNFEPADAELLEKMLYICKQTPNSNVDDLNASEIDVKYSLNLNDNMQIKTQSLGTCIGIGMPPSMALRITRLSNDPEAEGKIWQEYLQEKQAEEERKAELQAQREIALASKQKDTDKSNLDSNK